MEYQLLIEALNNTGFPIAACGALFWLVVHLLNSHSKILVELKEVLASHTKVMNELLNKEKDGK
jgi:hypothetical protein